MSTAIIVFTLPDPEDSIEMGMIIANAKRQFEDMPDVKIYAVINDAAQKIMSILDPSIDKGE